MTNPSVPGKRYQDYVISEGKYIGRFEDMYRNSAEIPWHQDETANAIFSDLTIAILRRRKPKSMLDVGCGLGFMTARMKNEIPGLEHVVGLDVSETAIVRARQMFPELDFQSGDINAISPDASYDVVVSKDVIWYVLDDLQEYLSKLACRSSRWVYIGQSFPERRPFFGDHLLPDAGSLVSYISSCGYAIDYSAVERDAEYSGREYAHVVLAPR